MQNFQAVNKIIIRNRFKFVFVALILCALFFRLYNFESRIIYGPEQARTLLTASRYLDQPTLLGQEYFRYSSDGHKLYYSAGVGYFLLPFIVLANFDPLNITLQFAMLNILVGIFLYLVVIKHFSQRLAVLTFSLFVFDATMIYHSLFLWPYNLLPGLGVGMFLILLLLRKKETPTLQLLLGLLGGFGFGINFPVAIYAAIVFAVMLFFSKKKFQSTTLYLFGFIVGNLPMFVFDLRNDFYHLRTLWQYALDTFAGKSDASFNYYYLLTIWPLFSLVGGILLNKVIKRSRAVALFVLAIYIVVNLTSSKVNLDRSLGMPEGLGYKDIFYAANLISKDKPANFNVAVLLDFDTRGYILRYPLEVLYNTIPNSDVAYPDSQVLYTLSARNRDLRNPNVWELDSFAPYEIIEISPIAKKYVLNKLVKVGNEK